MRQRQGFLNRLRFLASLIQQRSSQTLPGALPGPVPLFATYHAATLPQPASAAALLSVAVAITAAAAALLNAPSSASCEAAGRYGARGDTIDPDTIKAAVFELWRDLDERIHRSDASHPANAQLPRIPEPQVTIEGGQVGVVFRIPQVLNVRAAAAELRAQLSSPWADLDGFGAGSGISTGGTTMTESSGPEGVACRLRRSSTNSAAAFTADVMIPHDAAEPARIEFRGAGSRANLALIEAVMRRAVEPPGRRPSGLLPRLFREFQGGEKEDGEGGFDGGIGPFLDPLRELMREFERMHSEHHEWGVMGEGEERDTWPTPSRRPPKRFDADDFEISPRGERGTPSSRERVSPAVSKLREMGCQVFLPDPQREAEAASGSSTGAAGAKPSASVDWGQLAGYEEQKRAIEDCLLLPLVRPDVYDSVAKGTREIFSPNRPRAVLFVGPPGTGKTTSARVIASQAAVPLVYIPLEALVSKWYGESEKSLATALEAADSLPTGCIVFLDELDALATSRGGEMHEATRRLLGVLLRHMDGFDSSKRSVVVGATNRPQDLDPALLSRFSATVEFGLPVQSCRAAILKRYAHHLGAAELLALAERTPGMAGRDLRDVCEQAERRWAAKIIRGQAQEGELPPLSEYMLAVDARLAEMGRGKGLPPMLPPQLRLRS